MATGDLFLNAREPDCPVAPGDIIDLKRLPGVRLEVAAVWKREAFGDRAAFMAEVVDCLGETFYLRLDDEREELLLLEPIPVSARANCHSDICHCGLGISDHRIGGAAEHNFRPKDSMPEWEEPQSSAMLEDE